MRVAVKYTEYAKSHYDEAGMISSTDFMTFYDIIVDMQRDRYGFVKIAVIYMDGTTTSADYEINDIIWNYPESGTVGDYYIKLARQLAYN